MSIKAPLNKSELPQRIYGVFIEFYGEERMP